MDSVRLDALLTQVDRMVDRVDALCASRHDAKFHEEDHPRAEDGKFGFGSGSGASSGIGGGSGNKQKGEGRLISGGLAHTEVIKLEGRTVFVNPTPNMVAGALKKAEYGHLRILVMGRDVAIADAENTIHTQMVTDLHEAAHPSVENMDPSEAFDESYSLHIERGRGGYFYPESIGGMRFRVRDKNDETVRSDKWPEGLRRALGVRTA